jgi:hypothetical protein
MLRKNVTLNYCEPVDGKGGVLICGKDLKKLPQFFTNSIKNQPVVYCRMVYIN